MSVPAECQLRLRQTMQCAATATMLLASVLSASAQDQPAPDRARVVAAIEAYRGLEQKFEQSQGPFKEWTGFYSRGGRCEFNEQTAARPPGMWEKGQFALWSDENYLYGMQLDASPAIFQFQYRFLTSIIGMDVYQLTRVDHLGSAAGIDDAEWRLFGVGVPNPEDIGRLGIRITARFMTHPDVHELGWLTGCGRGGEGFDPIVNQSDPLYFSIHFLQKRLATLPVR